MFMRESLCQVQPGARDRLIRILRNSSGLKLAVVFGLLFLLLPLTAILPERNQPTAAYASVAGMPHAVGNKIVDGSGNTLILQGAHISSDLYVINPNSAEQAASQHLDAATFNEMHNVWKMNVVRLFTSDF